MMDTDGTDFLQQTIGDREDARFDLLFYYLRFIATAQRLFRGAWNCNTLDLVWTDSVLDFRR